MGLLEELLPMEGKSKQKFLR